MHFKITLRPYTRNDGKKQVIVRYTFQGKHYTQPIPNLFSSKDGFSSSNENIITGYEGETLKAYQRQINDIKTTGNKILIDFQEPEPSFFFKQLFSEKKQAKKDKAKCLVDLYDHWMNHINTAKVYRSTFKHLKGFKAHRGGYLLVDEYGKNLLREFENYLAGLTHNEGGKKVNYKQSYIKKCLKHFKYLGQYLTDLRLPIDQNFRDFRASIKGKPRPKPIALTKAEFDDFFYFDLSGRPDLELIKSAFIIGTASGGIRVSDLYRLTADSFDLKNNTITFTQKKTNSEVFNPLAQGYIAPHIDYFLENLHKLPTEVTFNTRLKEIASLMGWEREESIHEYRGAAKNPTIIKKPLKEIFSSKFMRKTFISILVELGYSKQVIKSFTGHKDEQIIDDYIQLHQHTKRSAIEGFAPVRS